MNDFDLGKITAGFRLIKKEKIDDIASVGHMFVHEKSGARLFYAKNEDVNKVFFISFKTPPENDCGLAHIMEHSVLCGSDRYPCRDPFNELEKGSLNTYLNALTYSDKTVYPIGSCNEKDFENLFKVYADAVFAPKAIKEKKIFMQEGWHYELENEKSELKINGVVYNEMKGALSEPETMLENINKRSLFGKTVYGFESGGEPEAIPLLTYKNFCDFYHKYYYPSNSYIYLYGDMDAEKYMRFISENYLDKFEKKDDVVTIPIIKESFQKYAQGEYSVSEKKTNENDCYFSLNFAVELSTDVFSQYSMEVLSYVLFDSNGSPFKHRLIESGLCDDIEGWFDCSTLQMTLSIVGKNCRYENRDKFKTLVLETLKEISEKGIDKKLILSALNYIEFMVREADYGYKPKGLAYGMKMMYGWLHGADPFESIRIYGYFDKMRSEAENGLFEKLVKNNILENEHCSFTVIKSREGLQAENDVKTAAELEKTKAKMSAEEIRSIIDENKDLVRYQTEPESEEAIKTVPCLSVSEIDKNIQTFKTEKTENGALTLRQSNGIVYVQIMFPLDFVPKKLIAAASLLAHCVGVLDSEKYSFQELPSNINMYTGGISARCEVYEHDGLKPVLNLYAKALERNAGKLFELLKEVTKMDFTAMSSLKKIISELKIRTKRSIDENGHAAAILRAMSFCKSEYSYREYLRGMEFYDFLKNADKDLEKTAGLLKQVSELVFLSAKVKYFALCTEGYEKELLSRITDFTGSFKKAENIKCEKFDFIPRAYAEAIKTGSKVVYNAKAADFSGFGYSYSGKLNVLKNIINTEYLWNVIRVKGGAYGCGCVFARNGSMYFYSYRDPNCASTFDAFDNASEFLKNISLSEESLEKYILGAINEQDRPKSCSDIVEKTALCFMNGITEEMQQKSRDELLSTKSGDIRGFCAFLKETAASKAAVTVGNESIINKNKDFYEIIKEFDVR